MTKKILQNLDSIARERELILCMYRKLRIKYNFRELGSQDPILFRPNLSRQSSPRRLSVYNINTIHCKDMFSYLLPGHTRVMLILALLHHRGTKKRRH